jgi:RDD family protein
MMEQQEEKEILREEREEMNYADPVPKITRFVNCIVDQIAIGVIINGLKFAIAYLKLGQNYRDHIYYKVLDPENIDLTVLEQSMYVSLAVTFLYYFLFEGSTQGRTLGKIMTNTVAITQDGTPFTYRHALMRTLCRFIPFEALSALLAYLPWHDSITKTAVVRKTW